MLKPDCIALLTIAKVPEKKADRARLVAWLRKVATQINKDDPKIYAAPCRARLMK